jgi:glycosyltransferase involved in cell wall biosynthesis
MKLLYVVHQFYPEFSSGTEKFVFNVSSAMQKDGHAVHVVTYTFQEQLGKKQGDLLVREYSYRGIPVTAVRSVKLPMNINTAWNSGALATFAQQLLNEQKPDLLHIAHPMRLGGFAGEAERMGIPYVVTLTDFWTICPKITLQTSSGDLCAGPKGGEECSRWCPELDPQIVRSRLHQAVHMLIKAKTVLVPSSFVASLIRTEFPELKVKVIPHGLPRPHSMRFVNAYRRGDKLVFAYAGGLALHKGVHVLLAAFRKVKGAAELRIYGSQFQQQNYFNLLQEIADRDSRIRFCGGYSDDQLDTIFQELDVLVLPSLCYETYSFSVHEALSRGVPVIASRLGIIEEVVQDGIFGFVVRPGDIDELARTMEKLLADPGQLNDLKARLASYTAPLLEEEAYLYERVYRSAI